MPTTKLRRRRKGQGSLYKQDGIYIARWIVGGKVYARSTSERELRAAERKLASFVAPFAARTEAERYEALAARAASWFARAEEAEAALPKLRLDRTWQAYERSPKRRPIQKDTLSHYAGYFASLRAFLAKHRPEIVEARHVDADAVADYLDSISNLSPNTYNKHVNCFAAVWRTLAPEIGWRENPWLAVARRTLTPHSRRALSDAEVAAVFAAADAISREAGVLFRIGAFTGLRLADCCFLDWSAVDLANGDVRVKPRKTARSTGALVAIPIMPELRAALESTPPQMRVGPVLPEIARRYRRDTSSVSDLIVNRAFHAAGIETNHAEPGQKNRAVDVGFHSLRHTFVTRCALAGVPLPVVRAIVGHSTTAMTEHYAHSNLEAARTALARAFPAK